MEKNVTVKCFQFPKLGTIILLSYPTSVITTKTASTIKMDNVVGDDLPKRGTTRRALLTCHCERGEHVPFNGELHPTLIYAVWQGEIAPETKKFHYQIYAEFNKKMTYKQIQKAVGCNVHIKKATNTDDSRARCRAYCMKEDTRADGCEPTEIGQWREKAQGERTDLKAIAIKLQEGASLLDIAEEAPDTYMRNYKGLAQFKKLLLQKKAVKRKEMKVVILYGPTGTGKSQLAEEMAEERKEPYYKKTTADTWWTSYEGQKTVIIEEFRPEWRGWDISYILKILDKYACEVEIKGGDMPFLADFIIITSNDDPEHWYPGDWDKLERRIDEIVKVTTRKDGNKKPIRREI